MEKIVQFIQNELDNSVITLAEFDKLQKIKQACFQHACKEMLDKAKIVQKLNEINLDELEKLATEENIWGDQFPYIRRRAEYLNRSVQRLYVNIESFSKQFERLFVVNELPSEQEALQERNR